MAAPAPDRPTDAGLWEALAATPRWWPDPRCAPLRYLTGWRVPSEVLALTDEPEAVEVFFELWNVTARGALAELERESPASWLMAHLDWIGNRLRALSLPQIERIAHHLDPAALRLLYILERVHVERGEVLEAIVARVWWLAERYARKPLHGRRRSQVESQMGRRVLREELADEVASAQWLELWSPPGLPAAPDPLQVCPPRSPREIHGAIAREVTEGLLGGPDPDRKRSRAGRAPLEQSLGTVTTLASEAGAAARCDEARLELYVLCQQAKRRGLPLSKTQEQVLELYCQDLTQEEIGQRLGKPRGTVKKHFDRLTEKFRAVAGVG